MRGWIYVVIFQIIIDRFITKRKLEPADESEVVPVEEFGISYCIW